MAPTPWSLEKYASEFWAKVDKTSECWYWRGNYTRKGYGACSTNPRLGGATLAHRVALMLSGTTLLPEHWVKHRCGNTICVRPDHMFVRDFSNPETYFWEYVDKKGGPKMPHMETRCWPWTKQLDEKGYGVVVYRRDSKGRRGTNIHATRATYYLRGEEIPEGQIVCHRCDNPGCVRPSHLFLGTSKTNAEDMVRKKRSLTGSKNPSAKLTESSVRAIRRRFLSENLTIARLAREYGVARANIRGILTGKTWRHVGGD